ncbi:ABC transporter ATP-binding protein [Candidatus Falkowbacteria bacterium]|nr:ABC transporter ATP-binding protein [Candidatus Falkowbacteria bacterium]
MLQVKNLSKTYDNNGKETEVIKNLSFEIGEKQFIALVGPSGCGKTTILKIIAGLLEATSGEVFLDNKIIYEPGQDRGMVFQNFTLFPWLTVRNNIGFGLDVRNINHKEKDKIIEHYLRITDLIDFADFYPKSLSGGMQQRVAIARTLANDPKILLMDEPFGSLDSQTRSAMQEFLTKLWESEQKTILFVTHDVEEAIFLADKVILLTTRPARIKKEYSIDFQRPRLHNLKFSEEFFKLEREITRDLES